MTDLAPLDPAPLDAVNRLREGAAQVRHGAAEIGTILDELRFFDRPDVWQGARATAFRDAMATLRNALVGPTFSVVADLDEAARRMVLRADGLAHEAEAAARRPAGPLAEPGPTPPTTAGGSWIQVPPHDHP